MRLEDAGSLPKSKLPVLVGPPAPPAPTLAQFDRNVVVLRGKADDGPDQLTCDTLKLSLVPGEKPAQNETANLPTPTRNRHSRPRAWLKTSPMRNGTAEPKAGDDGNQGLFGGLTLQRAHATGHAVWLILPNNGIKLRCNEMIHVRQLPFKPDQTYFRGDRTRPVEIVKVDVEHEDEDEERPIKGRSLRSPISGQSTRPSLTAASVWTRPTLSRTGPGGWKPDPIAISRSSASPSGRTSSSS